MRAIEVKYRRLHTHCCGNCEFVLPHIDEMRQIASAPDRIPCGRISIRPGNRSKGAPLVNGQPLVAQPAADTHQTKRSTRKRRANQERFHLYPPSGNAFNAASISAAVAGCEKNFESSRTNPRGPTGMIAPAWALPHAPLRTTIQRPAVHC